MGFLFSSESVSEGHPDKLCDQISDAILDAAVAQDPNARVAAECFATTGLVVIGGEITSTASLDIQSIARNTIKEIGYTSSEYGLDGESCAVLVTVHEQSPDIAQGVNKGEGIDKELGAGDQGIMFGYACRQTPELMPMPISIAHKLVRGLSELRHAKTIPYLRPDAKSQVTVQYEDNVPVRVDTVVISTQHDPDVSHDRIVKDVIEQVIRPVIPAQYLDANTRYLINPTGRFVIGGPHGDTGLTGRKIIIDTYGGWGRHGGGAFSGKDCTKVDRSACYMARYVAKNIVAAQLADEVEIQLAYAIGVSKPVSIRVDTRQTAKIPEEDLVKLIWDVFDLTPEGIIKTLVLREPVYRKTAAYGHFGRTDVALSWEQVNQVDALLKRVPVLARRTA
jgi:S-adenosylmethionine synthetase